MENNKVVIGMSGGVDSSVCALLLKQRGYESFGATLFLHNAKGNCGSSDIDDARAVADKMGIFHGVYDYCSDFDKNVMSYFADDYCHGRTPNPCVQCNRTVKFPCMFAVADELGCKYVATGHYARVEYDENRGRWILLRGKDISKDQSYVLYNLKQEQLARILLPIGEYSKPEIRRIAAENGFINAQKSDSQDICFIPDGDYVGFINRRGINFPEGDFVDGAGNILGRHKGLISYTTGQRKGLGVGGSAYPLYVLRKNSENNTVVLGAEEELFSSELIAENPNWIAIEGLTAPMRVSAKTRYSHKTAAASIYPESDGRVRVVFDEPQRALTCGQSAVFYDGDVVVGGGVIAEI